MCKILNKNLNFISRPTLYAKQTLDAELQTFLRMNKHKGYFKNKQKQLLND